MNGQLKTAKLKTRTVPIDGKRRLLFGVPRRMARELRKSGSRVFRHKVNFGIHAVLRFAGASSDCDQDAGMKRLRARVTGVNVKRALISVPWSQLTSTPRTKQP